MKEHKKQEEVTLPVFCTICQLLAKHCLTIAYSFINVTMKSLHLRISCLEDAMEKVLYF